MKVITSNMIDVIRRIDVNRCKVSDNCKHATQLLQDGITDVQTIADYMGINYNTCVAMLFHVYYRYGDSIGFFC